MNFILHAVLSNMTKSHAVPRHPHPSGMNHSFVQHIHTVCATLPLVTEQSSQLLDAPSRYHSALVSSPSLTS
jgi:hypothetical protein